MASLVILIRDGKSAEIAEGSRGVLPDHRCGIESICKHGLPSFARCLEAMQKLDTRGFFHVSKGFISMACG